MFEYEKATITAREMSIGDVEDAWDMVEAFPEGKRTLRRMNFIQFLLVGSVEGKFPVQPMGANASPEAIREGYAVWRKLPQSFDTLWQKEFQAANTLPKESSGTQTSTG